MFLRGNLASNFVSDQERAAPDQRRSKQTVESGKIKMKSLVSGVLTAALMGTVILTSGAGVANADSGPRPVAQSAQVNPLEEARSMCIMSKSKRDCEYLLTHIKMNEMVKECLIKGGIGGAGALIASRFVSKDVAKDIVARTLVAGATGCLAALA